MKEKQQSQYDNFREWITEGVLIDERHHQLMPVEALQNVHCQPGVINLFYQQASANDAAMPVELDDVSKAPHIINRER